MESAVTPVLLVGAGNMGGALVAGWRAARSFAAADVWIRDPNVGSHGAAARDWGARIDPADADLVHSATIILAVKPQVWRAVATTLEPLLRGGAVVISIMAGIDEAALRAVFPRQKIARAMPTTAAALNAGAASLWSSDPAAKARARAVFEPLGVVVDLDSEDLMHVATAASGSAPAYVYALAEALQAAAEARGLDPASARALSRAAITGAAALLQQTGVDAAELRRQVTSPGGTTAAALAVLMDAQSGLPVLMDRAVEAAALRSKALSV